MELTENSKQSYGLIFCLSDIGPRLIQIKSGGLIQGHTSLPTPMHKLCGLHKHLENIAWDS